MWLGIGVLALGAAVAAQVQEQPSLAEAAKAAKEQKAKAKAEADAKAAAKKDSDAAAGKKYTNEHLDERPRPWSSTASRAAVRSAAMVNSGRGGKDEAYWRRRAEPLRQRLQRSTNQLNIAKARLEGLKADGVDIALANGRSSPIESERQRQIALVRELEARVSSDEQAMKDLEDEGRRAGALPGWFR